MVVFIYSDFKFSHFFNFGELSAVNVSPTNEDDLGRTRAWTMLANGEKIEMAERGY